MNLSSTVKEYLGTRRNGETKKKVTRERSVERNTRLGDCVKEA